jgi:hypothetical protein
MSMIGSTSMNVSSDFWREKLSQASTNTKVAQVQESNPSIKQTAASVVLHLNGYGKSPVSETYGLDGLLVSAKDQLLVKIFDKSTAAVNGMKAEWQTFINVVESEASDLASKYMRGVVNFGVSLDTSGDLSIKEYKGYAMTVSENSELRRIINQGTKLKNYVVDFYNAAIEFENAFDWPKEDRITPESFSNHDLGSALEMVKLLGGDGLSISLHNINAKNLLPEYSEPKYVDFESLTRKELSDWVDAETKSGRMSWTDASGLLEMAKKVATISPSGIKIYRTQSELDDQEKINFKQMATNRIAYAKEMRFESLENTLARALKIMG